MSAHVLVAEDKEMRAEVIRRYLEQDGHCVTLVRDGHAHGVERGASERTIDVPVRNLRKKIEADPGRPVRLLAVSGVGSELGAPRPSGEGSAGRVP